VKNEENAGQTPSEPQQSGQPLSLLVVKTPQNLSQEQVQMVGHHMEPVGLMLGAKVIVATDGMDVQWQQDLGPLVAAIAAQTEAITRLAQSNEALVEAMGQDDADMVELPVSTYMDGSRVL